MSELFFHIDAQFDGLLLHLEEGKMQSTGYLRSARRILYLCTLRECIPSKEEPFIFPVIGIHKRSCAGQSLDTLSFQKIEIPKKNASECLRGLIQTKRLLFQKKSLFETKGALIWKGIQLENGSWSLEGFLKSPSLQVPLKECEWILPSESLLAISGNSLWFISSEIPWKWIDRGRKGPFVLEGHARQRFLDEDPIVEWQQKEGAPLPEIFPELVLCDAVGCSANLWLEYGLQGRVCFDDLSSLVEGIARDRNREKGWEADLLEAGYLRKQVGDARYYCPGDRVSEAIGLLLEVGWSIRDRTGKKVHPLQAWKGSISEKNDRIVLEGEVFFSDTGVSLKTIARALKQGKSWIELENGVGWIDRSKTDLVFRDLEEFTTEDGELVVPKECLSTFVPFLGEKGIEWQESLRLAVQELGKEVPQSSISISSAFQSSLLPYQEIGVSWLSFLYRYGFGGLLADEMGLGKTVQILAFLSTFSPSSPVLIVVPTSLLYNWKSEFARFLPHLNVKIHAGSSRARSLSALQAHSYILTSYAILRQDESMFSQIAFDVVILDESHAIKNEGTLIWKAVSSLSSRCRICLSGTPIENRIQELHAQFSFLMPSLLKGEKSLENVRRKTKPFLLRRKKKGVALELPDKIEQTQWIEMEESQKKTYMEFQQGALLRLRPLIGEKGGSSIRMELLEAILRLRQICCDPDLVQAEGCSAKLEQLLLDVEGALAEGSKVLIYSQFTSMLHRIAKAFESRQWPFVSIEGKTSAPDRMRAVEIFQQDPNCSLFLLSLKAGGVGLNLTAADYVILFDPWWNEAVERQAIDRAHRIGQKNKVIVKRYLIPHTIEEKMGELKRSKLALSEEILEDGDVIHPGWTAEDLLFLLEPEMDAPLLP